MSDSNSIVSDNLINGCDPYSLNGSSNGIGGTYNGSNTTITFPNTTYQPLSPNWTWQTSGGTQIYGNTASTKYSVLELPRKTIPMAVYVCGRLMTVGALGTNVECAYTGNKLVFEPGTITTLSYNGKVTISLQYKDKTYHYNVGAGGAERFKSNSTILDAQLLSTVDHKSK